MNTPTLSLIVRTPIRLIASITASDDTATQATWQISTVSNFASTVVDTTATSAWATVEYAIPAGQETTTYYVRVKVSDGTTESSWSSTLTVTAAPTPTTPTIAQLGATPQRIGVYVSNLAADDASVFEFQFSKSNTFTTVLADVTGGLRAEYLVPSADRATTHYVRARAGNLQDVTSGGTEVYSWSAWSSTLTVTRAGQLASDDISSLASTKVERTVIGASASGGFITFTGTLDEFLDYWQLGEVGGVYEGKIYAPDLYVGAAGPKHVFLPAAGEQGGITTSYTDSGTLKFSAVKDHTYRIVVHIGATFAPASDFKIQLTTPATTFACGTVRSGQATDSGTGTAVTLSSTSQYPAVLPGAVTLTAGGTTANYCGIEYDVMIRPSADGTIAVSTGVVSVPAGAWVYPQLLAGSFMAYQDLI